jgi:EAL domain-containing protein (putative c-di-GMP-specific phosphodiesterase class I)
VAAPAGTADVAELLRRADAALRRAKRGGGTVGWYEPERDAGGPERPALLAELRRALDRDDELVLALQPVVDLTTGAPAGVEALVRWRHPQRGLLPPAEFVRAVENSDLLGAFTEYVIDRALAAAARWARHGPAVPVAVNLSARSLLDPRLPDAVAALLRRHKLPGRRLVLEITESVVGSDLPGLEEALRGLRALGVRLAVDDFGTGHASLTMLTRLPLDEVKVDGVFVTRLDSSVEAAAIVRATVELGRELGLRVVAEGVETAEQLRALTRLGCTTGQGFHLAPPTSVNLIGETLRSLGNPSAGNGELRAS